MTTLKATINKIQKAGFDYLKIECEGNFKIDSYRDDDNWETCYDCDGSGQLECEECGGSGIITTYDEDDNETEAECLECNGSGETTCQNCYGDGGWQQEADSDGEPDFDYIYDRIIDVLTPDQRDALLYSEMYYDSSVNTEWTFTINIQNASYLPTYLEAFKNAGLENTCSSSCFNGMTGLHITVMNDQNMNSCTLNRTKLDNFKREASKLLAGLTIASTPSKEFRGFYYCKPQISSHQKYSAIYTNDDSLLEYRIFHTCYDHPEKIFDYLQAIAGTLKFYSKRKSVVPEIETGVMVDGDNLKDIIKGLGDRYKIEINELLGKRLARKELQKVEL